MDSPMAPSLVESERRGGDRVTTDTPFFIVSLSPQGQTPAAGGAPALAGTR
jgi:hypothetical protein